MLKKEDRIINLKTEIDNNLKLINIDVKINNLEEDIVFNLSKTNNKPKILTKQNQSENLFDFLKYRNETPEMTDLAKFYAKTPLMESIQEKLFDSLDIEDYKESSRLLIKLHQNYLTYLIKQDFFSDILYLAYLRNYKNNVKFYQELYEYLQDIKLLTDLHYYTTRFASMAKFLDEITIFDGHRMVDNEINTKIDFTIESEDLATLTEFTHRIYKDNRITYESLPHKDFKKYFGILYNDLISVVEYSRY